MREPVSRTNLLTIACKADSSCRFVSWIGGGSQNTCYLLRSCDNSVQHSYFFQKKKVYLFKFLILGILKIGNFAESAANTAGAVIHECSGRMSWIRK